MVNNNNSDSFQAPNYTSVVWNPATGATSTASGNSNRNSDSSRGGVLNRTFSYLTSWMPTFGRKNPSPSPNSTSASASTTTATTMNTRNNDTNNRNSYEETLATKVTTNVTTVNSTSTTTTTATTLDKDKNNNSNNTNNRNNNSRKNKLDRRGDRTRATTIDLTLDNDTGTPASPPAPRSPTSPSSSSPFFYLNYHKYTPFVPYQTPTKDQDPASSSSNATPNLDLYSFPSVLRKPRSLSLSSSSSISSPAPSLLRNEHARVDNNYVTPSNKARPTFTYSSSTDATTTPRSSWIHADKFQQLRPILSPSPLITQKVKSTPVAPTIELIQRKYDIEVPVAKNFPPIIDEITEKIKATRLELERLQQTRSEYEFSAFKKQHEEILKIDELIEKRKKEQEEKEKEEKEKKKKPISQNFLPLPDNAISVVKKVLAAPSNTDVVEAFNLVLTGSDIQTLRDSTWLNDEVINFYMKLIMERSLEQPQYGKVFAFNTFFYSKLSEFGYGQAKRWTKKVDIFQYDKVLIPVHLGMHWCMAMINFQKKRIEYYDSLGGSGNQHVGNIKSFLVENYKDKHGGDFDLTGWTTYSPKDIPHQKNGHDCGVFSCTFAEFLSRDEPFHFSQGNMDFLRKRIVYEIASAKLLPRS